jgi:methylmalonyl-CoA mutase cobalamin-binding subunit
MNIGTNTEICYQWLKSSLQQLKSYSSDNKANSAILEEVKNDLVMALYQRNLEFAKLICENFEETHSSKFTLIKELLIPAVYEVEQNWISGARDFNETVLAFWHLQTLLDTETNDFKESTQQSNSQSQRRIVLATAPNCEHNLGVLVLSDQFRSCGWKVSELIHETKSSMLKEISACEIDVLGISIGHDAALEGLTTFLINCRSASKNPQLKIILGGNIFELPLRQYEWIGADFIASTPLDAIQYCNSLINQQGHTK